MLYNKIINLLTLILLFNSRHLNNLLLISKYLYLPNHLKINLNLDIRVNSNLLIHPPNT